MTTKTENLIPARLSRVSDVEPTERPEPAAKRAFVEPEVSFPIDVLEATTFFQLTDSGATN
ncbi:MAG TPA: hypothetical protein VF668_10230 [Pyrinomonadaceae bacterium]